MPNCPALSTFHSISVSHGTTNGCSGSFTGTWLLADAVDVMDSGEDLVMVSWPRGDPMAFRAWSGVCCQAGKWTTCFGGREKIVVSDLCSNEKKKR